jgi:uncharacterized protein
MVLLDTNVLIALVDPAHRFHDAAEDWFVAHRHDGWATCPITQNGLVRIISHTSYPNSVGSPAAALALLHEMTNDKDHHFWPDDISLFNESLIDGSKLLTTAQVTDTYLLALAVKHGGKLATFDRRLVTTAVKAGAAALQMIG